MGTSSSVGQFTGKLEKLAKEMKDVQRPLEATALRGKQIFLASAGAAGALGAKPEGKRKIIGARFDTKGKGVSHGSAIILYTGAAHLLNNPITAHEILPRRRSNARTRRRQAAHALRFPDGGFASSAPHPGTRGKHFFERAKAECAVALPRIYSQKQLTEPLRRTFH